jgi:hypothetical protein
MAIRLRSLPKLGKGVRFAAPPEHLFSPRRWRFAQRAVDNPLPRRVKHARFVHVWLVSSRIELSRTWPAFARSRPPAFRATRFQHALRIPTCWRIQE